MGKKVAILGGGISGLSLAWYLQQLDLDLEITLVEKQPRLGGWIETKEKGGFLFEAGPRSFRPSKSLVLLDLIEELGLIGHLIVASKTASKRYLYRGGELLPLPQSPFSLFSSPLTRGMLGAMLREWFIPPSSQEDETIYDFAKRRFNLKVAKFLFDPLTSGIYAGDIRNLSIKSCFPILHEYEQKKGSILKGIMGGMRSKMQSRKNPFLRYGFSRASLFSMRSGIEHIVSEFEKKLNINFELNTGVERIRKVPDKVFIDTSSGSIETDHVFCALPLKEAARVLTDFDSETFSYLNEMKTATLVVVNLGYDTDVLSHDGFGYLVPSGENQEVLGMVFDSNIYPIQNRSKEQTRLSVMIGGAHLPEVRKFTKEECLKIALQAAKNHLKIDAEPVVSFVNMATDAIPQFEVGHYKRVQDLFKEVRLKYPQLDLAGNYLEGVSVASCVERSKKIAQEWKVKSLSRM